MTDFTANFTLENIDNIDATFVITSALNKTSELTNDSNFISDANYVHTDNNFTTAYKSKLDGIQDGAEVNVNADWNATAGDAQILNKPDITTTARQSISETVEGLEYSNTTGVLSLTSGYIIPTLTNFNNKVDKEAGKGLSENDFTDADKLKLDTIQTGGLLYKGGYDASSGVYPNNPSNGDYYLIIVAGTILGTIYNVGDQMIYSTIDGWTKLSTGGALDSQVVHNTGNETIYGNKTFEDTMYLEDRLNVGTTTFDVTNPEFLKVDGGTSASVNIISGYSNYDDYVQLNIKNSNDGVYASSDIVATADVGQEGANFIDMGINNSNYDDPTFNVTKALDGYMYVDGGDMAIGTASPTKKIKLFTGGTLEENLRATISDTGIVVNGAVSAANLSGTNTGDQDLSSYATIEQVEQARLFAVSMAVVL